MDYYKRVVKVKWIVESQTTQATNENKNEIQHIRLKINQIENY